MTYAEFVASQPAVHIGTGFPGAKCPKYYTIRIPDGQKVLAINRTGSASLVVVVPPDFSGELPTMRPFLVGDASGVPAGTIGVHLDDIDPTGWEKVEAQEGQTLWTQDPRERCPQVARWIGAVNSWRFEFPESATPEETKIQ